MQLWWWKILQMETPKTKQFTDILKALKLAGKKTLFVMPEYNENVYLSFRNVPSV